MEQTFRHNLGDRVKDRVSGFTGIVTSRSEHLFGCARYWVEPEQLHEGKPIDGRWFDEESLTVVLAGAIDRPEYARVDVTHLRSEQLPELARAGGPTNQPSSATRQSER